MAVPLAADEERTVNAECEDQVFQRAGMPVVDQVVQKCHVTFIDLFLELAEGDARCVDDGCLRAEMVDQSDPSLSVKDLDMVFRRNVEMLNVAHCLSLSMLNCL